MELEPEEDEKPGSPAQMLAKRAKKARKQYGGTGLALRALGTKLGFPHSYLARVESGEQLPSLALAETMDDFYETDGLFTDLLALTLAVSAETPKWGHKVLEAEKRAGRIQTFNSSVVPGLLQTEAYTTALYTESMPGKDAENITLQVAKRAHRRAVLDSAVPPLYWAIMDEAALRRPVGGAAVMADQIRHILKMTETKSNVQVQVLPFSRGVHPLLGGSLSLLTLRDGATFAYVESFASGVSVESPADVLELATLLDIARSKALDSGESVSLFREYLKEYEDAE
ncbi:helix-turn-helix domain-containing protein [Streptomyces sp. NPDC059828]|uniref:helix-turn-helix domain-containing protein n=1 Tax=Streptomyces sp. NPDC059828 TaxID=3346965 RepID=UPI003653FF90